MSWACGRCSKGSARFPSGRGANGWTELGLGLPGCGAELLGVHQTPGWLPKGVGRVLLIDATRFKTPAGTGDDVRLHQSSDLRAGRMEQVQLTDRHQAESLSHFELQAGDLVVTDAGYPVGSSVEQTQESKSFLLQRTAASQLHLEDEEGQTISLKERVKHVGANSLKGPSAT